MLQTAVEIKNRLPATFTAPGLSEQEFLDLREEYPDCILEYTSDGTIIIMPPTDPRAGRRTSDVVRQLGNWAVQQGKGEFLGPDTGFRLPDGSRLSPDAAWYETARFSEAELPGTRFPVFAPEFVIEVRSPDDKLRLLREKMDDYIANGVKLAWLVDPIKRTITIYRQGREPETLSNPTSVSGEGPVEGFVLDLSRIFN